MNVAARSEPDAPPRTLRFDLAWVVLGSCGLAALAHLLGQPFPGAARAWWASAWLAAVLATAPRARWGTLALAAFASVVVSCALFGAPPGANLAHAVAATAEGLAGGALADHLLRHGDEADSPLRFALLLLAVSLLPPTLGAAVDTALTALTQPLSEDALVRHGLEHWTGDSFGALGFFPFALGLRREPLARVAGGRMLRSLVLVAVVVLLTLIAFSTLPRPFSFASLMLGTAALVAGPRTLFLLVWACTVAATCTIGRRLGPPPDATIAWQQLNVFLPIMAVAAPIQVLSAALQRLGQANRVLQRSRDELAALSSTTTDLAIFLDRDLRYRNVNRAFERYWDLGAAEVLGRHQSEVIGHALFERDFAGPLARALAGEACTFQSAVDFRIGQRLMEISVAPAYDAAGTQAGVVLTLHDVTALVQATRELSRRVDELRHANEGLEQFARIAAHDLREPLNTVSQFAGLILEDHADALPPEARRYFDLMGRAAIRMKSMLDDVLLLVRLEQAPPVGLDVVSLERAFAELRELLHARLTSTRAALVVAPGLPAVLGHASLVELLLQNLLTNAMGHTAPGMPPQIEVSAERAGDLVVVTVADDGAGLPPDELERIFQPFHRLPGARPDEDSGLGLVICRRIASALGGRVWAEADPRGGSRFRVELRAAPAA